MKAILLLFCLLPLRAQDFVEVLPAAAADPPWTEPATDVLLPADLALLQFEHCLRQVSLDVDSVLRQRLQLLFSALGTVAGEGEAAARVRFAAAVGRALFGSYVPDPGSPVALEARALFDGDTAVPRFVRPRAGETGIDWYRVAKPPRWRLDLEGTGIDATLAYLSHLAPAEGQLALLDQKVAAAWHELQPALALRAAYRQDVLLPLLGSEAGLWQIPADLELLRAIRLDDSPTQPDRLQAFLAQDQPGSTSAAGGVRPAYVLALQALSSAPTEAALGPLLTDAAWQLHHREVALWGYLGLGSYGSGAPTTSLGTVARITGRTFVEPRSRFYAALLAAADALRAVAVGIDRCAPQQHGPTRTALVDELRDDLTCFAKTSDAELRGQLPDANVQHRLRRLHAPLFHALLAEPLYLGNGCRLQRRGWLPLQLPIRFGGARIVVRTAVLTIALPDQDGVLHRPDWAPFAGR